MKILITGCAGFIGSNLVKALQKGNQLFGFDNFSTGRRENLKGVAIKLVANIHKLKPDLIFHLGMPSSSPIYREDRYKVLDGIKASLDVFELAKATGAKVVYASSSSLYNGNIPPFREDMEIKVTDFYTETRYFVERLAKLYSDMYGIVAVGLRLFSVYGPGDAGKGRFANTLTQFALDMAKGKSPLIYGDGNQTRDFIHVDDVVRAFLLAKNYSKTDIFNVGTGIETSFNKMIAMLNFVLKKNIKPKYVKNPIKNYVDRTLADTSKAERILKFRAKISLEDGLSSYIPLLVKMVK
jgi:UDP-glucose 4-epimerase